MTGEEAKRALLEQHPIVNNGIEYLYVSAIIYRRDKNKRIAITLELMDKSGHSVTYAPIESVEKRENGNEQ